MSSVDALLRLQGGHVRRVVAVADHLCVFLLVFAQHLCHRHQGLQRRLQKEFRNYRISRKSW